MTYPGVLLTEFWNKFLMLGMTQHAQHVMEDKNLPRSSATGANALNVHNRSEQK
jgi:hypothetical protein